MTVRIGAPPKSWSEFYGDWKPGDPDSKKGWASGEGKGLTAAGGTLAVRSHS